MRAGGALLVVAVACLALVGSASAENATDPLNWMCTMDSCAVNIETPNGIVWSSNAVRLDDDEDYFAFKGIPYAASTAGENRWKAPQDPEAWSRDANIGSEWGPICPQDNITPFNQSFNYTMSEDCLRVNVFTPSNFNASSNLPVMVWIHGGTLVTGSGQDMGMIPEGMVNEDVILVTINYRLGFLGYFAHPELNETNFGLKDQVKALKWVQQNIQNFGGDPDKVTIIGESAGGLSVLALMASPLAEGLFQNAIAESAACLTMSPNVTMAEAGALGVAVGKRLNISEGAGQLDQMKSLPADLIVEELFTMSERFDDPFYYSLANIYVDESSMPEAIAEAFKSGAYHEDVNIIIGSNGNENVNPPVGGGFIGQLMGTPQSYQSYVDSAFGSNANGVLESLPTGSTDEEAITSAKQVTLFTMFGTPAYLVAAAAANSSSPDAGDVYFYQFTYASPDDEGKELGAYHGAELPYVFNATIVDYENDATDRLANQELADIMNSYWTNFAKTGNPNAEETQLPTWPSFDDGSGSWQVFGETVGSEPIPETTLQIYEWGEDIYPTNCIGGMLAGNNTCWSNTL